MSKLFERISKELLFGWIRYKKVEDRTPMDDVMNVILPILFQRFMQLFTHQDSDQSALIQKQILKIFHAYTQVILLFFLIRLKSSL